MIPPEAIHALASFAGGAIGHAMPWSAVKRQLGALALQVEDLAKRVLVIERTVGPASSSSAVVPPPAPEPIGER